MRCASCSEEALPGQQFCARHRGGPVRAASGAPVDVYASFWQRFGAFIVDYFIVSLASAVLGFGIGLTVGAGGGGAAGLVAIACLIAILLYYPVFESSPLQGTPGKLALSIKVTDREGERIGFGRALGRYIGRYVSAVILCIGYLFPLFTARREALHDMMAGTLVVEKKVSAADVAAAGPAPRTSGGMIAAVLIVMVFGSLFIFGMLAAISIPAYQDYTVRSQVASGIGTAQAYKSAVAEEYGRTGTFQGITKERLFTMGPRDPYVESFEVTDGVVIIRFGSEASESISGKTLALAPALDANDEVAWICGRARTLPNGTEANVDAGEYTTVQNKYLPRQCRGNAGD